MHYYPHHIGDFIKDTANLDDHQLATYMRMLWAYYLSEQPLADAPEDLAFAFRSNEKCIGLLLRHYFTLEADGWHHKRCDEEIAVFHGKAEKARASASARWNKANAMRTHTERIADAPENDANQEPRTINQEPEKKNTRSATPPRPDGVDEKIWADFLTHRKTKKAAVTLTALTAIEREAGKAGMTLEDALTECVQRGWVGFKAEWMQKSGGQSYQNGTKIMSFKERDDAARRARYEETTGRKWPENEIYNFIDLVPKQELIA